MGYKWVNITWTCYPDGFHYMDSTITPFLKSKVSSNCTADQQLCFRYSNRTIPSATVFTTRTVQSHQRLCFRYLFDASCLVLRLYTLVCFKPGLKPKLLIFSYKGFAQLISDFAFTTLIVQSLFYLTLNFDALF